MKLRVPALALDYDGAIQERRAMTIPAYDRQLRLRKEPPLLSSFSERRREPLTGGFTGVVPAACDAEAGEPEEVVLDQTASPQAAVPSAGNEFSVRI
jgi:hypothetical protein